MFRLLVSGARIWDDSWRLNNFLDEMLESNPDLVIVHGGCPSGADAMAQSWAESLGVPTEVYPANWLKYGKPAGHIRNKEMVDTRPDYAVVFIKGESRGTNNCLKHIQKAGIPHGIFRAIQYPDSGTLRSQ